MMRKWWVVPMATVLMALGTEAQATETVTLEAEITRGNGVGEQAFVDPDNAGDWTFSAEVSGQANEVLLQLWEPDRHGGCTGTLIGERYLSVTSADPTDKPTVSWNKRQVAPGSYTRTIPSDSVDLHCARVLLWGRSGARVTVNVTTPVGSKQPILELLPL